MADRAFLQKLSRELTDQSKIIEAGWIGLRIACELEDAPAIQLQEMRQAFFAGAQHLFSSIIMIMDSDREPTENDLKRMDLIEKELQAFINNFIIEKIPAEGSACPTFSSPPTSTRP